MDNESCDFSRCSARRLRDLVCCVSHNCIRHKKLESDQLNRLIAKFEICPARYRGGVQSLRSTRRTIGSKVVMGSLG
jgi:hypothetical protein